MKNERYPRFIGLLIIMVLTALGCSTVTGIAEDAVNVKNTAQSAATQVGALVTNASGFATTVGESGILKTAEAFATEQGPALQQTAQAFGTQVAGSGLLETAQVAATQGLDLGNAPDDIPVVPEDQVSNFFGSVDLVTYNTSMDIEAMIDFYKTEMIAEGWTALPEMTDEAARPAVLFFTKPERTARVTLTRNPLDETTIVFILIEVR